MANPYPPNQGNYGQQPMQQQQQPMQQMPPQQMQQPPRGPNVTRQGTSRAVPVVVSAGLAVGVFCGLLFGVGIPDTTASPSTGNNVKPADPAETTPTPSASTTPAKPATTTTPTVAKPATVATPATGSGSAATTAAKPAAGATAGSATPTVAAGTTAGSGSAPTTGAKPAGGATPTVAATPALKKVKLIVEVKPDTVAATAKISVDKTDIVGGTTEIEIPGDGKKEVKVVVKASGYKTVEQKVEVEGDVTVKVELIKRSGGGGTGGTPSRPPTGGGGGGKKKPPSGGLIDI